MSNQSEEIQAHRRRVEQRAAERLAKAEADHLRRRRRLRIEIGLFLASALFVAGLLYYDTTRVSPDFYALHMRFGQIVSVHEGGGHLYRIPILDRVVLIDRGTRPLPALRRSTKAADGKTVAYEALLTYRVVDAEKYWARFHGADADGARLVLQNAEAACGAALAQLDSAQLAAADTPARLGQAATAAINAKLADSGLTVDGLRFVSLRLAQ